MTTKWLSVKRERTSTAEDAGTRLLSEQISSDRARVVFCASFRRLHQKTQVFALESDAAVRTRLSHSLEVAHIGMYLVDRVFKLLDDQRDSRPKEPSEVFNEWSQFASNDRIAIRTLVEVACLVHDIGNPPFGHFGEKAICTWFNQHEQQLRPGIGTNAELYKDFDTFDGNKQGFRILTRLQRNRADNFGLNLTYCQLASTIKYPSLKGVKRSYFESERSLKEKIWNELGLEQDSRHPLSLLMEAADDIAYCVSDIEDASDKGIVPDSDLTEAFQDRGTGDGDTSKRITDGRTKLTVRLVKKAAEEFVHRLIEGSNLTERSLLSDDEGDLARLKLLANKRIYSCRLVLSNEVTGFTVIKGLLDAFSPLLASIDPASFRSLCEKFAGRESIYEDPTRAIVKRLTAEPGLLSLFPRKHLSAYLDGVKADPDREAFLRAHLVVDFVSGMTDEFALGMYRLVSGQRIYGSAH